MDLMEHLPKYWENYVEMNVIQSLLSEELTFCQNKLYNNFHQNFINSATDEGLKLFELEFGIVNDKDLTIDLRREVIIAKLRGAGTTTKELIKNIASSFSGGDVDVVEKNDRYLICIKFTGTKGIPLNMDGFKRSIRDVVPAHLDIEYSYTYSVWNEFSQKTWGYLKDNNITHKKMRVI